MGARYREAPGAKNMVARLGKVRRAALRKAERIAQLTEQNSAMAQGHGQEGGRYGEILAAPTKRGARAAAQGPFAHLDEWGSVNNVPSASMRRAAESVGKLRPNR